MNAHLIISEEYKMNQPSVFIFSNGQYYGCLTYPKIKNFPSDVNFWETATSSDTHRGFSVRDVEYSPVVFEKIQSLQNEISVASSNLKSEHMPYIMSSKASKNSKEYKAYLVKVEEQNTLLAEILEHNKPYDQIISKKRSELRSLLLSVLNDEN